MKNRSSIGVLNSTFRRMKAAYLSGLIIATMNGIIFALYDIMLEPFFYASGITIFILLVMTVITFLQEKKQFGQKRNAIDAFLAGRNELPVEGDCENDLYRSALIRLAGQIDDLKENYAEGQQEVLDYYTAWVHQIKTPIAVMKLRLDDDTEENRALSAELFRIEQYVEMVLQYAKLGKDNNDLMICEYRLDDLIRESIRKYASQFIQSKLKMRYCATDMSVITDKKWFCCILDQLLSNAIKYTNEGSISIFIQDDTLVIEDTGIGIAAEDLPRIFEKGFTGINGRTGRASSGLGLYLASKAAKLIDVSIEARSKPGHGSSFMIHLGTAEKPMMN